MNRSALRMIGNWILKTVRALCGAGEEQVWLSLAFNEMRQRPNMPAWKAKALSLIAFFWARRASRNGDLDGSVLVAHFLSERRNPGDRVAALTFYRTAAEGGHTGGMQSLACCYEQGIGTERDLVSALHWYKAAADAGRIESQLQVATWLMNGTSGTRDIAGSWKYAMMAQAAGAKEANQIIRKLSSASKAELE